MFTGLVFQWYTDEREQRYQASRENVSPKRLFKGSNDWHIRWSRDEKDRKKSTL